MLKLKDKYKRPTEKEEKEREERREEAVRYANESIDLARACLETGVFRKYKAGFLKAKEKLLLVIEEYHDDDPIKYAFGMNELTTKLRDSGALLKGITLDANKREIKLNKEEDK